MDATLQQSSGLVDALVPPQPSEAELPEQRSIKQWTARIKAAKARWDADFKRMRDDMNFVAGYQWDGQEDLNDDRYVANFTLRAVRQKVAQLYARDPKAVARRRKRLDYQIWDGRIESLQMAMMGLHNPASMALLMDYTHGRMQHDLIDKIGQTLEVVYRWMTDNQQPTFKTQMKQLVGRVVTCGVAYVRINFSRSFEGTLATSDTESTIMDRIKKLKFLMSQIDEGKIDADDPRIEEVKMLVNSIQASAQAGDMQNVNERLVFDFPAATSVIVDPQCRALKGFVNAQWVAQEYVLPVDFVNEWFETDVKADGEVTKFSTDGKEEINAPMDDVDGVKKVRVAVYEVFHLPTKSTFFFCEGHKAWLKPPEAVSPETNRFWPHVPLTFNDVECDPGSRSTIYPPSDVQLLRSVQKEWNRSRDTLRSHRRANAPRYFVNKGLLTNEDKEKLSSGLPNEVIEVGPPGANINDVIKAFTPAPIDPLVYETQSLTSDIQATLGNQEVSQPVARRETATGATINEQARLSVTASNVDDLDDLLIDVARACSEILLRELSSETVIRIAGPGAVWPQLSKEDFVNELFLDVVAASSGRPNKALELSNWQVVAPILQSAGASPQFIIRETLKRLDDRLEPEEAFPLGQTAPMGAMPQSQQTQQANTKFPNQHRQQIPREQQPQEANANH